jgi:hypothetical protein
METDRSGIEQALVKAGDLDTIEELLFASAEDAAAQHDLAGLAFFSGHLREVASIRGDLGEVAHRLAGVAQVAADLPTLAPEGQVPNAMVSESSANRRQHARDRRALVLGRLRAQGVRLTSVSEAVYRTPSGKRVGMPFSSEINGGWWLGLYDGRFDVALLLCEREADIDLVYLDESFFARYGTQLSRDSKNNIKFNVERGENGYVLEIPGIDPLVVADVDIVAELV